MMGQQAPNPLMAALAQAAQAHQQGGMPGGPGMMPHPGMPPGMPGMPPGMPGAPPMGGMPQPGMPPQMMPPGGGMPGMMPHQQGMPPDMRSTLLQQSLHMLQAYIQVSPMGPDVEHAAQLEQGLQLLLAGVNGPPQGAIHGIVTMPPPPPPADDGTPTAAEHLNGGIPGGQGYAPGPDIPPEGLEADTMPPQH